MSEVYPVNTLAEMAEIPDDALPRFLVEIPVLIAAAKAGNQMKHAGWARAGNFRWRDDGNPGLTARMVATGGRK